MKIRTARRALDACTAAYCRYQLLLTGVHVDVRGVLLPNNWQQGISRPWFYLPYLHNGLCTHLPHSRKGPRGAWYRRAYGQDDASID
ncbi:MAG: hypothetical protein KF768_13920 [Phycisphaeraceae bacterium]|nr:hypothetical protein [Phycisphaeraceae bacterium]